ncbi:predicted protein [Naegleria gruberi]|uniref:Predicted protein n=1 Tax=Naegleria gruberi TaxID=5762 RepID=D2VZ23_NAEGR|nr:uncharacterized protein NAEGRDRAFT_74328 [Naegleria gruberi]EFC37914.1 predicted protein [Naegleria gruberi]|eukprot:XP_002670658.1 predicted protein [Naegleria gruberi strain NEG-M]
MILGNNYLLTILFCMCWACLTFVNTQQSLTVNLYISQHEGSDSNSGNSTTSPFQTIAKASQWIQTYKNSLSQTLIKNVTIYVNIDDGRYFFNASTSIVKPSKFNDRSSPVYWKPWRENGEVIFSGAVPLPSYLWKTFDSNDEDSYSMLPQSSRGHVKMLNLTQAGFSSSQIVALKRAGYSIGGTTSGNELFFRGKVQTVARYPNKTPQGEDQYLKILSTDAEYMVRLNSTGSPNRMNWPLEKYPFVFSYFYYDWADELAPLSKLYSNGTVQLQFKPSLGIQKGQRIYVANFLSELDMPGEYIILDDVIFFWPPSEITANDDVMISVSEHLIVSLANGQLFSNLKFEMCRGVGLVANTLTAIEISHCTFSNIGNRGISMTNCDDYCKINYNTFYEIGQGGLSISAGSRTTLTSWNALVMGNTIFNYSRIGKTYRPAISVQGVGITCRNNEIYNGDHVAIMWGGNNHDLSYNKIHNVCKSSQDSSAIYSGRDWTQRGNLIRYNYIYNVKGMGDLGATCIYLDDMFSSVTMYGNILVDCYRGLLIGGGRDNVVFGNVFVNNTQAIYADDRGLTWANTVEINTNLLKVPFNTSKIWIDSYPTLPNILNDEPNTPKGNNVTFNVFVGKTSNSIFNNFKKYSTYSNNTAEMTDSIFVNFAAGNFTVLESYLSLLLGVQIPIDQIGVKLDQVINSNSSNNSIPSTISSAKYSNSSSFYYTTTKLFLYETYSK